MKTGPVAIVMFIGSILFRQRDYPCTSVTVLDSYVDMFPIKGNLVVQPIEMLCYSFQLLSARNVEVNSAAANCSS